MSVTKIHSKHCGPYYTSLCTFLKKIMIQILKHNSKENTYFVKLSTEFSRLASSGLIWKVQQLFRGKLFGVFNSKRIRCFMPVILWFPNWRGPKRWRFILMYSLASSIKQWFEQKITTRFQTFTVIGYLQYRCHCPKKNKRPDVPSEHDKPWFHCWEKVIDLLFFFSLLPLVQTLVGDWSFLHAMYYSQSKGWPVLTWFIMKGDRVSDFTLLILQWL